MSDNPFRTTEAWEVNTEKILGDGNHVVNIVSAEDGTSSGGHPQIELQLRNADGEIRDWLVITEASVGKVVALAQAAGVDLPDDTDIIETGNLRLRQAYLDKLYGQVVGIVVRDEQSFKDPTKMISRVQGYVTPSRIKPSEIPSNGEGAFAHPQAAGDKDIPF